MQQEPHSTEQGVVWSKNSQIPVAHHKLEEYESLKSRSQCMTKGAPICKQTVLIKCSWSVWSQKLLAVFTRLWVYQSIVKNSPNLTLLLFWLLTPQGIYGKPGNTQKSHRSIIGFFLFLLELWLVTNAVKGVNIAWCSQHLAGCAGQCSVLLLLGSASFEGYF